MRRRDFIKAMGGTAAAWLPFAARAQQPRSIGFLSIGSLRPFNQTVAAFQQGLNESGYVDGRNVVIEYRWSEGKNEQLPAMAADLLNHQVAVLAVLADIAITAAKATTTTTPIVFMTGGDPVKNGFVASLSRPGGNITGATWFSGDPMAKRLDILHRVLPDAAVVGQLVDLNFQDSVSHLPEVKAAAQALGLQLIVEGSRTPNDIDTTFASLVRQGARAFVVGPGGLHFSQRERIVGWASHYAIPAIYPFREFAVDGGLMSYGNRLRDSFYWAGTYVGRILKGEKPAELPVIEATKFELVFNLKTAKTLKLEIPPTVLATADEVIE